MKVNKQKRNGGFSLVEFIIVIAIMVILVAILAPLYLRFFYNAKISSDIQTASELVTTVNTEVAAENEPFHSAGSISDFSSLPGVMKTEAPSMLGGTYTIYGNDVTGVSSVTLTIPSGLENAGTYNCYPYPEGSSGLKSLKK